MPSRFYVCVPLLRLWLRLLLKKWRLLGSGRYQDLHTRTARIYVNLQAGQLAHCALQRRPADAELQLSGLLGSGTVQVPVNVRGRRVPQEFEAICSFFGNWRRTNFRPPFVHVLGMDRLSA